MLMYNFSARERSCVIDRETVAQGEEGLIVGEGHSGEL